MAAVPATVPDHDLFLHVRTLVSLVIGLSITQLGERAFAAANLLYQASYVLRRYNLER